MLQLRVGVRHAPNSQVKQQFSVSHACKFRLYEVVTTTISASFDVQADFLQTQLFLDDGDIPELNGQSAIEHWHSK